MATTVVHEAAGAAYERPAQQLRAEIKRTATLTDDAFLLRPEVVAAHIVSHQTVRRAIQDLVVEGTAYPVPCGTYTCAYAGKHLRSFGSIDDLLTISGDTELEVRQPPLMIVNLVAAGRLLLDTDEVVTLISRRFHENRTFCLTTMFLPPSLGRRLADVTELGAVGVRRKRTVLRIIQSLADITITEAQQSNAVEALGGAAGHIGLRLGGSALRIDRPYFYSDRSPSWR